MNSSLTEAEHVFDFDFIFDSQPGVLRDVIADFVGNSTLLGDRIDLSSITVTSFIYSGGILQVNTDFDIAAELEIRLQGAPVLVASDIIF